MVVSPNDKVAFSIKKKIPNSRLECTNHTLLLTKMVKIDTPFKTKTAKKPYPLAPTSIREPIGRPIEGSTPRAHMSAPVKVLLTVRMLRLYSQCHCLNTFHLTGTWRSVRSNLILDVNSGVKDNKDAQRRINTTKMYINILEGFITIRFSRRSLICFIQ